MFKEYIKEDHIIKATEKAYEVIYKQEGYIPYEKPKRRKKKGDSDVE